MWRQLAVTKTNESKLSKKALKAFMRLNWQILILWTILAVMVGGIIGELAI